MFGIDDVTYTKETPTPIYYGIYKAGALINKVPVTVRHCVDVNAGANTQYAVTAIYADGTESAPSGSKCTNRYRKRHNGRQTSRCLHRRWQNLYVRHNNYTFVVYAKEFMLLATRKYL